MKLVEGGGGRQGRPRSLLAGGTPAGWLHNAGPCAKPFQGPMTGCQRRGLSHKTAMHYRLLLITLCLALASCDSFPVEKEGLDPVVRRPKVASIDLPAPVDLKMNFGGGLVFPEGA